MSYPVPLRLRLLLLCSAFKSSNHTAPSFPTHQRPTHPSPCYFLAPFCFFAANLTPLCFTRVTSRAFRPLPFIASTSISTTAPSPCSGAVGAGAASASIAAGAVCCGLGAAFSALGLGAAAGRGCAAKACCWGRLKIALSRWMEGCVSGVCFVWCVGVGFLVRELCLYACVYGRAMCCSIPSHVLCFSMLSLSLRACSSSCFISAGTPVCGVCPSTRASSYDQYRIIQ